MPHRAVAALAQLAIGRAAHAQQALDFHAKGRACCAQQHEAFVTELTDLTTTLTGAPMLTIESPNRYVGRRAPIRVVVLHTMETGEDGTVAQAVGRAFADPTRQASAHVGCDAVERVRYVADTDTAWAAPGVNADGLQLEMAGRAAQVAGDWVDGPSLAILEQAAQQVAEWCRTYGIPVVRLTDAELAAGKRGIIDHHAASRVYKLSDHTDVGDAFPWATFLARVSALIGGPSAAPPVRPVVAPATRVKLTPDGVFGPRTVGRLQQWLGVTVDSQVGPLTRIALQKRVGVFPDGVWGTKTNRAVQHLVGATQDGVWGAGTTRALQVYLNNH